MSTRVDTIFYSDISGTEFGPLDGHRRRVGYQGKWYELDLTGAEAEALDELLLPYLEAGARAHKARLEYAKAYVAARRGRATRKAHP